MTFSPETGRAVRATATELLPLLFMVLPLGSQYSAFAAYPGVSKHPTVETYGAHDLLEFLDRLNPTIAELSQAIEREVEKCPAAQRLMTHPGVGPLTALAFVLIIGDADRSRAQNLGRRRVSVPKNVAGGGLYVLTAVCADTQSISWLCVQCLKTNCASSPEWQRMKGTAYRLYGETR